MLIVEHDDPARAEIGDWLEEAGFDVIACPGPLAPDYVCVAGWGRGCALASASDAVVLNIHQASDLMMRGTLGWQLFLYYYEAGKRIVALTDPEDAVRPVDEERVRVLPRPVQKDALISALHSVLEPARARAGG
ncbi:MAG: hypothetical protein ACXVQS_04225 [Actinomycetota bacterium]